MLVFAAHVPHSPLLMPSINSARITDAEKTLSALNALADDLYAAEPQTLVILCESKTMYADAFSLNVADPYIADLSDVGDLSYHKTYHPDFAFIDGLQRFARRNNVPVSLSTDEKLTFPGAVPLHYLATNLKNVRIVPIAPTELDGKAHFAFGSMLKHLFDRSDKRVALISSGDMGHSPHSADVDEKLLTFLKERNSSGLLQMNHQVLSAAQDTSYRQIAMLLGALDGMEAPADILSYERPFGTGYAVVNFLL